MRTKSENGPNADLERLLEDIKVVVRDGQELLKTRWGGVKERALTGARITDRKVREYPYQTLGIMFGAGLLIGLVCAGMLGREEDEEMEQED